MTAEEVYVDPSALARLYIHQAGSREMAVWRAKLRGALPVTHHGRTEVINAICRAAFLGQLDPNGLAETLADFSSDFASGHLRQADVLWRAALNLAAELSQRHTPKLGTRSLDVLHVACALELKLRLFVTFDIRQQLLAAAAGLRVVSV
ncbi:MAG TPA: type II toxin-antitoxin system VapC family toxin [Clostridia bacterium]|nr:type II toxin-antitoxin system VapC family toxin [Clostridia bacterium]